MNNLSRIEYFLNYLRYLNNIFFQVVKYVPTPNIHPIRLNKHYILWYRNVAVFIVSLIIPLVLLGYWNFNTLLILMRRRRLRNRPSISNNQNVTLNNGGSSSNGTTQIQASSVTITMENGVILNQTTPYPKARQGRKSIQILHFT